jgi:hypothetical protein
LPARFVPVLAVLAFLPAVMPATGVAQVDSGLRLGTGTGFQTNDAGLARFGFGQLGMPPAYDVIRGSTDPLGGRTSIQPLANLTGTVGNLSWDVGVSALALPGFQPQVADTGTTAYQGRLGVGYEWGSVAFFGGASVVPSPDRRVGSATYLEGGASVTAPLSLVFGARVGYQWLDSAAVRGEAAETVDWSLGVSREMFGFTFSLQYGGSEPTNGTSKNTCDATTAACDQRLFFSIDRRF